MLLDFEAVCRVVREAKGKKAMLSFHSVGDRDGVGSAIALSACFDDSVVVTPDFITGNAKRMLLQAGYGRKIGHSFPSGTEIVVITDANNLGVMGGMGEAIRRFRGMVLFIDHHAIAGEGLPENFALFNSEEFNSASSIVYEIMKRNREKVSGSAALLLLNGIIADSADFQNATPLTFRQVGELLELAHVDYSEILEYFHTKVSADERYRLMKEVFSARTEVLNGYILTYGTCSRNASLAAETAISFGADASVFWVADKREGRLSARLRAPLDKKLSVHLGRLMQDVGRSLGGNGGGHPCAAGAYGPSPENAEAAAQKIVGFLRKKLSYTQ